MGDEEDRRQSQDRISPYSEWPWEEEWHLSRWDLCPCRVRRNSFISDNSFAEIDVNISAT